MAQQFPRIIGHRGACAYAPENTLESFHTAISMGVEWVEFDVKITRDQIPIIFHDDTLERTTNGNGPVQNYTLEEIREFEAGSWFGDTFAGITIPTLEEALDILIESNIGINVEIKPCPGRERETAEVALDTLSQIWDDHKRILISSFSHTALETAQDMVPDWSRGLLIGDESPQMWQEDISQNKLPKNWHETAQTLEVSTINIQHDRMKREQVEDIIDADYIVMAYTVNTPDDARRLQAWGIDSMFTDVPDVLQENLFTIH
jgi:glycerophosphoryl diester phosphodiesterase